MSKTNSQKPNANDSGLNFEAQFWAAAEQAGPAPHCGMTEYNRARPEGLCLGLTSDRLPALQQALKVAERSDSCYFNLRGWQLVDDGVEVFPVGDEHAAG